MPDPAITAATGWGISVAGWLVSPIISRILNKCIDLFGIDATERLNILDVQVWQLQRLMQVADETYRVPLEPLINKVKSALYEAEDILDSVEYEILKKKIEDAKSDDTKIDWLGKLLSAMPSNPLEDKDSGMPKLELEESLNKIENAISEACKVLEKLRLSSVLSSDNGIQVVPTNSPTAVTTGCPPLKVIGRDEDRKEIIKMLHEKEVQSEANTGSGKGYSVIGIHGIAGSGKSTLAQSVYDHEEKCKNEKTEGHFDMVMWVHVSQIFDLDTIFKKMVEEATEKPCPTFNNLNTLQKKLKDLLCGKQILLILDDVWCTNGNARRCEELNQILRLLHVGKEGSRILVTSRTEDASVALGAVRERRIPISDLDDKDFLEMFMSYALPYASVAGHDRRKLEMIGEDIAKKLKRSPLAARIVGSRLSLNQTFEFWRREKNQNLMSETMGALRWSYQYLDEQVRRCFAYCSIFPRGHNFKRDELIRLWVAEGFVKSNELEEDMEDVAQYYFDELVSASFLQVGGKVKLTGTLSVSYFGTYVDAYTIHDLLCDLAEEVAGRDCFRIEEGSTKKVSEDVRHLYVGSYNREMLTEQISQMPNLRTLIINRIETTQILSFTRMFAVLMGLRKLRVLKLHFYGACFDTFKFPDSIGQMKHLRLLGFTVGYSTGLAFPGTFTKLYHMQALYFGVCGNLKFSSGEDMMNLVNLCCLVSFAAVDFPNIGRLIRLRTLPHFNIKNEQGYEPHQLKHLNKLQGVLLLTGLENIQSKEAAVDVNLAGKEDLTELRLNCNGLSFTPVLEGLCPSKYLEKLDIRDYYGTTSPNWMMSGHNSGPMNLRELELHRWSQTGHAPELGAFIHLRFLHLSGCSWNALPDMEHLTSLKKLRIADCKNMRSLGTLPKSLEEFRVDGCTPEFKQLFDDYWSESRKDC